MVIIGAGNTGMLLASMMEGENTILISTAHQDSANFKDFKVNTFTYDGAGKRYGTGRSIWETNEENLRKVLKDVVNERVVIFSSLGGGSGSSSLPFLSRILLEQNCKVLIAAALPHKKEVNPPLSNAVQAVNGIMPLINQVSVILFNNEKLLKNFSNDWAELSEYIVKKVGYLNGLLDEYSVDSYSPLTIDQSELDSVVFGGGFIDVSDEFLEESNPKFEYGKIDANTKNLLVAMFADVDLDSEKVNELHSVLTTVTNKLAGRARNSRLISGIIRARVRTSNSSDKNIKNRAYVTIASGLSLGNYLKQVEKMRDDAMERASHFAEKTKVGSIVSKKDIDVLDI